nr:uncharacterized protein LOC123572272 [Macaca fascicularis]
MHICQFTGKRTLTLGPVDPSRLSLWWVVSPYNVSVAEPHCLCVVEQLETHSSVCEWLCMKDHFLGERHISAQLTDQTQLFHSASSLITPVTTQDNPIRALSSGPVQLHDNQEADPETTAMPGACI